VIHDDADYVPRHWGKKPKNFNQKGGLNMSKRKRARLCLDLSGGGGLKKNENPFGPPALEKGKGGSPAKQDTGCGWSRDSTGEWKGRAHTKDI